MNIRAKFTLIVLPLVLTPLILTGIASSFAARNGITRVATELLKFKAEELESYAESQWSFVVGNRLAGNPEFIDSVKTAVRSFAQSIKGSPTELILAAAPEGIQSLSTEVVTLSEQETATLKGLAQEGLSGWHELVLQGISRIGAGFPFEPFGWYVLVTEQRSAFYEATNQIFWFTGIISGAAIALTVALLLVFSAYLTKPMRSVLQVMQDSIARTDLSRRVPILYKDETGELAHTFNLMTGELEKAYHQIRGYALRAAVAQAKEKRIRSIFQKYVPKDVIEEIFADPDSMLVGKNQVVAVMFSDIRDFSSKSESMSPDEMVESLNAYFGIMVDIISSHRGIVDKYIGDTIMAIYGAPTRRDDDASRAVHSALEMLDALADFNQWQRRRNQPEFTVGIGINYGPVTVGNIGSEKKMDYTVVGDMVNLASRLQSLTKVYKEKLLISEPTYRYLGSEVKTRMVDRVIVKGKTTPVGIFTVKKRLKPVEEKAWGLHEDALELYYQQEFEDAAIYFTEIRKLLPEDRPSQIFLERCQRYLKKPPSDSWTGVIQIEAK